MLGCGGGKRSGGGGKEGTAAGSQLLGGIEDLLLSSSLMVRRYSQSAFVGSIFWFSFMCLHGCVSIPLFEYLFWRMPVLCLWFNFLIFFSWLTAVIFLFQRLYD